MYLHRSLGYNPFQVAIGFQLLCSIGVAMLLATTQEKFTHVQSKVDKATKFIESI